MYFCIIASLIVCIVLSYLRIYWRPYALHKVRSMGIQDKCRMLSDLVRPAGFAYDPWQDVFVSRVDAWQREYDYCAFFDRSAPFFQMVFDYEPVYFDYKGRTWLIEFWKGQYGINIGCEAGIYHADRLLSPNERDDACYQAASDAEMLPIQICLYHKEHLLFTLTKCHWWLAGFYMGAFAQPDGLCMTTTLTFPDRGMMHAFTRALEERGYGKDTICLNGTALTFHFCRPARQRPDTSRVRLLYSFTQWKNRSACRLYRWATRPFCKNDDRLLYLYYLLPFAFRRILSIHKTDRRRGHGRR